MHRFSIQHAGRSTLSWCSTGSRRCIVACRSGVRYLISTMPSGSRTPPDAAGSAYISTCINALLQLDYLLLQHVGGPQAKQYQSEYGKPRSCICMTAHSGHWWRDMQDELGESLWQPLMWLASRHTIEKCLPSSTAVGTPVRDWRHICL